MTKTQIIAATRAYISEPSTGGILDVDLVANFILPAACNVNRSIGYYFQDSILATTAGDQEVTAPVDMVEPIFLELGSVLLDRIDEEQLQQRAGNWRQKDRGLPSEWYVMGGKIGFDCPLNAEADALTATLRNIATPVIDDTLGFTMLNTQDHFLPCLRAAELFLTAYGMDLTFARAQAYAALAEREEAKVRAYYAKRRLLRGP